MWTYAKMDKHCTANIRSFQDFIFKELKRILKKKEVENISGLDYSRSMLDCCERDDEHARSIQCGEL